MSDRYNPLISIVIPAYNASNYLAEAIDSALMQTYGNIEIIVVNDGSPDNGATRAVAESYGDKIRYFEKENGGSSSALNRGIKEMHGEWFSWLSHDDLYYPRKLESQIKYIETLAIDDEELKKQVFFGGHDLIDGKGNSIRRPDLKELEETSAKIDSLSNEYLVAEPTEYTFHGCTCLIHRSLFDDIGCFDEGLRLLNDMDLWYRIYVGGYKIHFISDVLVSGRVHNKQVSKSIGYSYHNPEQDMFWSRSLNWLKENHPDNSELFLLFGRNAYMKTRTSDGDRAFDILKSLNENKKIGLALKKTWYKLYAGVWNFAKQIYLKIFN